MGGIIIFIISLAIGSFLNVCIYRIPLGKSILWPPSMCPFCNHKIRWYDNVPLVSFLLLRTKCRDCGHSIPFRYFLVEFVTGLIGVVLWSFFSFTSQFIIYWIFICALIVVTFVDIEKGEVPDVISISGIFGGLFLATIFKLNGSSAYLDAFVNSVLGILAGGISMFVLGWAGERIFHKEALGGGDVKLMAMIGAFLGWRLVLLTFFLAPILGIGTAIYMKVRLKKETIAYGPYLAGGAVVSLLYGKRILEYFYF